MNSRTGAAGSILESRNIVRPTEIAAEDPFVRAGVAGYVITTIDPGRVHPALAGVLDVDGSRVRG